MSTKRFRAPTKGRPGLGVLASLLALALSLLLVPNAQAADYHDGMIRPGTTIWSGDTYALNSYQHRLRLGPSPDGAVLTVESRTCGRLKTYGTTDPSYALILAQQTDGNLVAYGPNGPVWWSGTSGHPGAWTAIQPDANIVVYSATGQPLWWSGTVCSTATTRDAQGQPWEPVLGMGQYMQSPDRRYLFAHQWDGNLVLYGPSGPLWWTGTQANPGMNEVRLRTDGNLAMLDQNGPILWQTHTAQPSTPKPVTLSVQNDGNVVLYRWEGTRPVPIWWTGTSGRS